MIADDFKSAVNGWKQANGIIVAQQRALDWCVAKFADLKSEGLLLEAEVTAREYYDVVLRPRKVGVDYLNAMRQSGAIE